MDLVSCEDTSDKSLLCEPLCYSGMMAVRGTCETWSGGPARRPCDGFGDEDEKRSPKSWRIENTREISHDNRNEQPSEEQLKIRW